MLLFNCYFVHTKFGCKDTTNFAYMQIFERFFLSGTRVACKLLRKKRSAPCSCFCVPHPQKNVFAGVLTAP